jgi:hypothetical protein
MGALSLSGVSVSRTAGLDARRPITKGGAAREVNLLALALARCGASGCVRDLDRSTLAADPFRVRSFILADIDTVREAADDPRIPLITTVPAAFTADETSFH